MEACKAREHNMLVSQRPAYVTILCLVRDAVARLPEGEGTRIDVSILNSYTCFFVLLKNYILLIIWHPYILFSRYTIIFVLLIWIKFISFSFTTVKLDFHFIEFGFSCWFFICHYLSICVTGLILCEYITYRLTGKLKIRFFFWVFLMIFLFLTRCAQC